MVGDLIESVLKRLAHVKDAGSIYRDMEEYLIDLMRYFWLHPRYTLF